MSTLEQVKNEIEKKLSTAKQEKRRAELNELSERAWNVSTQLHYTIKYMNTDDEEFEAVVKLVKKFLRSQGA